MGFFKSIGNFFKDVFTPGARQADEANKLQQQAINSTAANEAYWRDIANKLLWGENRNPETGAIESKPGQTTGAMGKAKDWEKRFFDYLETAPDLTYNAQRGQLERGIMDANKALKSNLNSRGLSNSVLGVSKLGNLAGTRALGLADLEGQRQDRKGQNIQAGTSFAGNLLDRALNLTKQGTFGTQVPALQSNYAGSLMNQANSAMAGGSIGQDLLAEAGRTMYDNMFKKTTAPTNNPITGNNVLTRFLSGGIFG